MSKSKIEWLVAIAEQIGGTTESWNVTEGCDAVSAGCANCYAARFASMFSDEWLAIDKGLV